MVDTTIPTKKNGIIPNADHMREEYIRYSDYFRTDPRLGDSILVGGYLSLDHTGKLLCPPKHSGEASREAAERINREILEAIEPLKKEITLYAYKTVTPGDLSEACAIKTGLIKLKAQPNK